VTIDDDGRGADIEDPRGPCLALAWLRDSIAGVRHSYSI
jgi:hypothetical protein